ncbi:MAG: Asp-tRNA(Asn)/Glu-tRNA(Gln) amidotransferase subunit GatC [bacterium]
MTKISIEKIDQIAALAKLRFNNIEKQQIAEQLKNIIIYVDRLNELDLENVAPTTHALEITGPLRRDEAEPGLTQEEVLQNAPVSKNGFFSVPKVI